jgi:predicted permease
MLEAVARLRDGVSIQQAESELKAIAASLSDAYPESNLGWGAEVTPFREWFVSPSLQQRVVVLLFAVGLLLLMACVNVANLLLSRAAVREREIAVRAALGAGRGRIVRQLLTESLMLSLAGTVVGIALAAAAIPVIRRTGSEIISRLADLNLDWTIVGFAVAACLATGLLFGVGPVLRLGGRAAADGDALHRVLRSGTRVSDSGRARQLLIGASVALAMIMLTSAALVGSSFLRLMRSDLGFSDENVLIANITFPSDRYNGLRRVHFMRDAQLRIGGLPGVEMVGASNIPPFGIGNTGQSFAPAERANERQEGYRQGSWRAITPGYFATLGINLKRGRDFSDDDEGARERVVIINETLANMTYPGEDPLGRQLASSNGQVRRIVGVVGDTRDLAIDSVPGPRMYWPNNQFAWGTMWLAVRSSGDHAVLAKAIRAEIAAMDPLMPVASMRPLKDLSRNASAEQRLTMLVFGIFASAALTLVAVGLYGLVSYTVTQRRREIGVVLALGAQPGQVVRSIVGDGLKVTLAGVAIGSMFSLLLSGPMRSILYETDPTSVLTFGLVSALLVSVGIVASALPARRASQLSPVIAMQGD